MRRLICRVLRHDHTSVYVSMDHEEGPPSLLGPMDRWTAEWFMVNELANHPFHYKRRVTRARIIGGN